MLTTLLVIFVLMMYHGPVIGQAGCYRYSLDFVVAWLVIVAPWTDGSRRRWVSIPGMMWSVFYFYMITRGYI